MAKPQPGLIHERAQEEFIIDTDFHLHLPIEKLYDYIDDDRIRDYCQRFGPPPIANDWDISYATGVPRTGPHDRDHGVAINRDEIIDAKRELGLDVVIVEPGTHLPFYGTRYPTIKTALATAYNDYVLDRVVDIDNGVFATVIVPQWDVDVAVDELNRVGTEPGFVAAQNWFTTETLWGDTRFDPIFNRLVDLELPLFLHTAIIGVNPYSQMARSMQTGTEALVSGLGTALIMNVVNMVMTGTFDQYPELDVAFQEAGTNWLPYIAYRADEIYQSAPEDSWLSERHYATDTEYLDRLPSEYMFDNIYVATQPNTFDNMPRTSDVEAMLSLCQATRTFMYSSDWPHLTIDPPDWVFRSPGITDDLRARILHETAEEVIRLPDGGPL